MIISFFFTFSFPNRTLYFRFKTVKAGLARTWNDLQRAGTPVTLRALRLGGLIHQPRDKARTARPFPEPETLQVSVTHPLSLLDRENL